MSLVLQSSGGGSVTINEPTTASNFTATMPAATGTVMVSGNMPAFSAYLSADQTITSATFTKVTLNAEIFDTANAFDATTNYRFTPQVAGYYQINFVMSGSNSTTPTRALGTIYKNGSIYNYGSDCTVAAGQANSSGSAIIYLNGSTDYIELYAYIIAVTPRVTSFASSNFTQMTGSLVRAA